MIVLYIIATIIGFINTFQIRKDNLRINGTIYWTKLYFITPGAIRTLLLLIPHYCFVDSYIPATTFTILFFGNELIDYIRVHKKKIIISQILQLLLNYIIFIMLEGIIL